MARYDASPKGRAKAARYNASQLGRAAAARNRARRIFTGGEYHSKAATVEQAQAINAFIKQRVYEFKQKQLDERRKCLLAEIHGKNAS